VLSVTAFSGQLIAHGTLHEQIEYTTEQINKYPADAQKYLYRGEAYRQHHELDLALVDYERAKRLDPKLLAVDLAKSKLMLEAQWYLTAMELANHYIKHVPKDATARIVRAKIYTGLDKPQLAIIDYSSAIELTQRPDPDFYLTRSRLMLTVDPNNIKAAIGKIDEGMQRLGKLITFQVYAIELEILQKNYTGALKRVDQIMSQANRKERWLAQRGDILMLKGQPDKAKASYLEGLAHIEKLPYSRQNTRSMSTLKTSLNDKLNKIKIEDVKISKK
jgi:tetratricopeptide (TPR) repeat protein